ncbi:PQQ-binding-like beta-propeller repeat protein, partial [Streptomyces sp. SPB074]|uniref:outer membrane protein assembly factor BamB family protein n=1 Tax=Streptomyces sp. (strain SPB074) TaxID=465543 RepID=UPI001F4548C3
VAFGRHGGACADVRAVDPRTGRTRWRHTLAQAPSAAGPRPYGLAVAGGIALARERNAVRGLALADGAQRWTRPVGADCVPLGLAAAGRAAHVVVECAPGASGGGRVTAAVLTLDARTGAVRHREPLPVESRVADWGVVAAEPFTLWVREADGRGLDAFVSFDGAGRARPAVPRRQPDTGELTVRSGDGASFAALPVPLARVVGQTLVVAVTAPGTGRPGALAGYGLADGKRRWLRGTDEPVGALMTADHRRVAVYQDSSRADRPDMIRWVDAATGGGAGGAGGARVLASDARLGGSPWFAVAGPGEGGIEDLVLTNPDGNRPAVLGLRHRGP